MSLTNPNKVVTEERLSEFYTQILPYLGGMPDLLANKFNRSDLYSTDEKLIGQWTDGKPLYQKTIDFGAGPNNDTKSVSTGIANVDTVVSLTSIWNTSAYGIFLPDGNSENSWERVYFSKVDGNICLSNNYNASGSSGTITIQYTKTTDSPVEIGNDTDYSTTEKIVGTWIDGKPLYQQTYIDTTSHSAGNNVIATRTDIDTMVSISGCVRNAADGNFLFDGYSNGGFRFNSDKTISHANNYNINYLAATILYTKITD